MEIASVRIVVEWEHVVANADAIPMVMAMANVTIVEEPKPILLEENAAVNADVGCNL